MDLKKHPKSPGKAILTIERPSEQFLLERAIFPARNVSGLMLAFKIGVLGQLSERYPRDVAVTHGQLGDIAIRLTDNPNVIAWDSGIADPEVFSQSTTPKALREGMVLTINNFFKDEGTPGSYSP